jgi:hypothetical protein
MAVQNMARIDEGSEEEWWAVLVCARWDRFVVRQEMWGT